MSVAVRILSEYQLHSCKRKVTELFEMHEIKHEEEQSDRSSMES